MPIIVEMRDGEPNPQGLVAYADGHVSAMPNLTELHYAEMQTKALTAIVIKWAKAHGGDYPPDLQTAVHWAAPKATDQQVHDLLTCRRSNRDVQFTYFPPGPVGADSDAAAAPKTMICEQVGRVDIGPFIAYSDGRVRNDYWPWAR